MALSELKIDIQLNKAYEKELNKLSGQLNKISSASNKSGGGLFNSISKGANSSGGALNKLSSGFTDLSSKGNKLGDSFTGIGSSVTAIGAVTVAIAGLVAGLLKLKNVVGESFQDFLKYEEKLADVGKTTGVTGDKLKKLGADIISSNKASRTSVDDLLTITEIAGQFGVAEKDLVSFTGAVDQFNVALGKDFGGTEQAVSAVTEIVKSFQTDKKFPISEAITRVGSAINELSANSSATSVDIADFTGRLAGYGRSLGVTEAEIIALGTTLKELGASPERSARGFQIFADTVVKDLGGISAKTKIPLAELQRGLNEDLVNTLTTVAVKLKQNSKSNVDYIASLDTLGLSATSTKEVIDALSGGQSRLKELTTLSTNAFKEATSVQNEFNVKNNTTQAQLDVLNKSLAVTKISLGEAFKNTSGVVSFQSALTSLKIAGIDALTVSLAPLFDSLNSIFNAFTGGKGATEGFETAIVLLSKGILFGLEALAQLALNIAKLVNTMQIAVKSAELLAKALNFSNLSKDGIEEIKQTYAELKDLIGKQVDLTQEATKIKLNFDKAEIELDKKIAERKVERQLKGLEVTPVTAQQTQQKPSEQAFTPTQQVAKEEIAPLVSQGAVQSVNELSTSITQLKSTVATNVEPIKQSLAGLTTGTTEGVNAFLLQLENLRFQLTSLTAEGGLTTLVTSFSNFATSLSTVVVPAIQVFTATVFQQFEGMKLSILNQLLEIQTAFTNTFQLHLATVITPAILTFTATVFQQFEGMKVSIINQMNEIQLAITNAFTTSFSIAIANTQAFSGTIFNIFEGIKANVQSQMSAIHDSIRNAVDVDVKASPSIRDTVTEMVGVVNNKLSGISTIEPLAHSLRAEASKEGLNSGMSNSATVNIQNFNNTSGNGQTVARDIAFGLRNNLVRNGTI